jgi:thiosulfate dehydrogenase (quinone) large subunit
VSEASLPITYVRFKANAATVAEHIPLPRWLCAIQAIVAYQWLLSGLNKLLNSGFSAHLPLVLQQGVQNNPYSWYVTMMRQMVLPHSASYASLLAWTETAVGAVLLAGAVLWIVQPRSFLTGLLGRLGCLALAAAAIISLNGYLLAGNGVPWIDPAHAYQQAVPLDAIMALIALALLGANLNSVRRS